MSERKEKFTPGPWDFTKGYRFYHCISTQPGRSGFYFEVGKNAASGRASFDEQWMANAALIAAAPDMYAALEKILELGQNQCGCGSSECTFCRARAALAKARGGS